jgi:hypothetical protein
MKRLAHSSWAPHRLPKAFAYFDTARENWRLIEEGKSSDEIAVEMGQLFPTATIA